MKFCLSTACLLVATVLSSVASANPEPTAYDTRSIGLALTGTAYLERPAALAINPANLEGIEKLSTSVMFTSLLTNQRAPVRGPENPSIDSGIGFGPIGSVFLAGRIAPRVVFGAGIYLETGYGSSFDDVTQIDGVASNTTPEDLDVTFFVGEFALGPSFRITDKLSIGVAVRLPFARQTADLWQNIGAALGTGESYGRVRNEIGGVGFPSPRFGIAYRPTPKIALGAMYRFYSRIRMNGTAETELADLTLPTLDAEADWILPHALQLEGAFWPIEKVMIVLGFRAQFHAADRHGNAAQTVTTSAPNSDLEFTLDVPFGWKNAYSAKIALEYAVTELFALRGGMNFANSATSERFAQYFTPPPGFSGFAAAGFGFNWDRFAFDVAGAFSFGGTTIADDFAENNSPATVPGTNPPQQVQLCSAEQTIRTACGGEYEVNSYWISAQFTYRR